MKFGLVSRAAFLPEVKTSAEGIAFKWIWDGRHTCDYSSLKGKALFHQQTSCPSRLPVLSFCGNKQRL